MTKQELKAKIDKLENGIKSKATPSNLIAPLKAQKAKFEKELQELEIAEKKAVKTKKVSKVAEKIKAAKTSVAKKTPAKAPAKEERKKDNIARDGDRKSLPAGKRVSKTGKVYYETRANRSDKQTSVKPYLAKGGETDPMASVNEISRLTGLRPIAVAEWGDKNNINLSVVLKDLKSKKIKGMDLMTAVVGNPNNKYQKELLAKYSKNKMADGGEIDWGADLGGGFSVGNDVYITDSKSLFQGKTGFVSGSVGRDLLVTLMDNGNERSVVVSKKGVERLDAPEYADGGKIKNQYEGKTAKEVWDNLSKEQRQHFLYDHKQGIEDYRGEEYGELKSKEIIAAYNSDWDKLDKNIKNRFDNHVREGQYAKGGELKKAQLLIIDPSNPLSTQLKKLTGDFLNSADFKDIGSGNFNILTHKHSNKVFIVYPKRIYDSLPEQEKLDDINYLKNVEKIKLDTRSMAKGGYVIFEGRDHYNDKPLYKIISKDEDNDYEGEFHDNREDAEKELNELKNKDMNYAKGGDVKKHKVVTSKESYANDLLKYADLQNIPASSKMFGNKFIVTFDAIPKAMDSMTQDVKNLVNKMADGGYMADGGEIYSLAENMTDAEYERKLSSLNEKQKKTYESLVRLGDSPKLALATTLLSNEVKWSDDTTRAYTMADGGEVKRVTDGDDTYYLTYIDSTHFYLSNSKDYKGNAFHIAEFRSRPFYDEVKSWLKSHKGEMMAKGGQVPAHFGSGKNIEVFGYETKNFDICGTAVKEFEAAVDIMKDSKELEKESLAYCAKYVDNLFGIEKVVVEGGIGGELNFSHAVSDIMSAATYNFRAGMAINLYSFVPQHLMEIALRLAKAEKGGLYALGGMTAGRWYKDKSGEEFKFIGKVDSGANKGRFLFSDGQKSVYKDLEEFEGGKPKETKLFGFFAEGGSVAEGNYEMLMSNIKAIKHHAEELADAVTPDTEIEAWVLSKSERAETDLSDITHYLDGLKMEKGGYMADGGQLGKETITLKSYNISGKEINSGDVIVDYDNKTIELPSGKTYKVENDYKYTIKVLKSKIKASGGINGLVEFLKEINTSDSPFNPSFTNQLINGFDKYAEGGELSSIKEEYLKNEDENAHSENVVLLAKHFGTKEDLTKAKEILALHEKEGSLSSENGKKRQELHLKLIKKATKEMAKEGIEFEKGGYMADGGEASIKNFNTMMNVGKAKYVINHHDGKKTHKDGSPFYDLATFKNMKDFIAYKKKLKSEGYKEYKDGGMMAKGGIYSSDSLYILKVSKDGKEVGEERFRAKNAREAREMGEDYEEKYKSKFGGDLSFSVKEAESKMAKGGEFGFKPYGKTKGNFKITYMADGKKQSETWETKEMAINNAKRYASPKMNGEYKNIKVFDENGKSVEYMAMGGKVKFADKVKSVQESLLKRKKVAPKVQKDYGKTYSKAEAKESAQRIVGSRMAQLKEKMAKKKK
jgi:hypothetical protein